jgi:hypothetical protein
MSAMGQGGEGQAQGEGQSQGEGQGGGPDLGAMVEQIGQVAAGQEEIRQFLANMGQQQQAEPEGEPEQGSDEIDLSWLDPNAPTYDDPQAVAQRLSEQINGAVDTRAQALVQPVVQQMTEMRRDQQARDLAAEFPEIAEPDMAQKLAGRGGLAEQMATELGQPALAAEPSFWRLVYMAHKAAESANAENGSGDPQAARLESGSGPGPASQVTEDDLRNAIINAGDGLGKRVLDFRQ